MVVAADKVVLIHYTLRNDEGRSSTVPRVAIRSPTSMATAT